MLRKKTLIGSAKANCPDQNTINMTDFELSDACKSLLSKGPSFVPTPYDINWCTLKQDFDNFVNKLRFHLQTSSSSEIEPTINEEVQELENPPLKKVEKR